jgi:hypothetical protein
MNPPRPSFKIFLSGSQGQLFGGIVAGQVIATSLVVVMACVFKKLEFHRVPFIDGSVEDFGEEEPSFSIVTNNNAHPRAHAVDAVLPPSLANTAIAIPNNNNMNINSHNNSAYGNVMVGSTTTNCQVLNDHVNRMQWNHSTHLNANY